MPWTPNELMQQILVIITPTIDTCSLSNRRNKADTKIPCYKYGNAMKETKNCMKTEQAYF